MEKKDSKTILEKIKAIFMSVEPETVVEKPVVEETIEVNLEQKPLIDGTIIEFTTWEIGSEVYVVAEDGTKTLLPAGSYEKQDGYKFTVGEDGKITEIIEPETETEEEVVETVEETQVEEPTLSIQEETDLRITTLETIVTELVTNIENMLKLHKEEVNELKTKLSEIEKQPAGSPIVHNPEKVVLSKEDERLQRVKENIQILKNSK